jgi:hypothetical protein
MLPSTFGACYHGLNSVSPQNQVSDKKQVGKDQHPQRGNVPITVEAPEWGRRARGLPVTPMQDHLPANSGPVRGVKEQTIKVR